jgi:sugar lactone lactonase YvrE
MFRILFFVLALIASACDRAPVENEKAPAAVEARAAAVAPAAPMTRWTVTEGVDVPESVYVDPSGFIFASQIVGMPGDKDGNGRIMKLDGDGKVLSASWASGLNAPKGLRSYNGTLWTADIDEVVGLDMSSGKVTSRVKIAGAQFLNDVACGTDGTVYVSDMLASKIYAVRNGKATVFAEGEDLEYPNGLLVEGDRLIVSGWGKPEADFSTKVPGRLFALDLKTKVKTPITAEPFANIDGLESDGSGGYVITDWNKGSVIHVLSDGTTRTLSQFSQGTADHAFVAAQNLLIVPHMNENKIVAYEISGTTGGQ